MLRDKTIPGKATPQERVDLSLEELHDGLAIMRVVSEGKARQSHEIVIAAAKSHYAPATLNTTLDSTSNFFDRMVKDGLLGTRPQDDRTVYFLTEKGIEKREQWQAEYDNDSNRSKRKSLYGDLI